MFVFQDKFGHSKNTLHFRNFFSFGATFLRETNLEWSQNQKSISLIKNVASFDLNKSPPMAFHRFDLNKSPPRNSTTSDDGAIIQFDEELENHSFMNSGILCFLIFS